MWVHMYACGSQTSSITPQGPPIHLIFFTCSSLWPRVWWLGKDRWSLSPKNCLSLPPQDWDYRPKPPTMAFQVWSEVKDQVLMLVWQAHDWLNYPCLCLWSDDRITRPSGLLRIKLKQLITAPVNTQSTLQTPPLHTKSNSFGISISLG